MKKSTWVSLIASTAALFLIAGCGSAKTATQDASMMTEKQTAAQAQTQKQTNDSTSTSPSNANQPQKGTDVSSTVSTASPDKIEKSASSPAQVSKEPPSTGNSQTAQGVEIVVTSPKPNDGIYLPGQIISFSGKVINATSGQKIRVGLYGGNQPPNNMVNFQDYEVQSDGSFQGKFDVAGRLYTFPGTKHGQFSFAFEYDKAKMVVVPMTFIPTN